MRSVLYPTALVVALCFSAPGLAKDVQGFHITRSRASCLLRVEGRTYLQGACDVEHAVSAEAGIDTVQVRPANVADPDYFASIDKTSTTVATGNWNGSPGSKYAQTSLGVLRKRGACWENPTVSLCVRD